MKKQQQEEQEAERDSGTVLVGLAWGVPISIALYVALYLMLAY